MSSKNIIVTNLFIFLFCLSACKNNQDPAPEAGIQLTDIKNFHARLGVPTQSYTISGANGGSFVSAQGTVVTFPANCFINAANASVPGNVVISFKDIYKKSDMLLSDVATVFSDGRPLKSGGEFMIKATFQNTLLQIAPGKKITIEQPLVGQLPDTAMKPMRRDTSGQWTLHPSDSIINNPVKYVFSLYQFSTGDTAGTWCNSDNATYFSNYPNTTLTLDGTLAAGDGYSEVFLLFTGINSMIHVYKTSSSPIAYRYDYAPVGLKCTAVAIDIKDGILYSSFVPVTIYENLNVHFTMAATNINAFKAQLQTLN